MLSEPLNTVHFEIRQ